MPDPVASPVPVSPRVQELLLGYLQVCLNWPGGDSVTVEEVLLSYPALARRGRVPDRQELVRCHPELSVDLEVFFASLRENE